MATTAKSTCHIMGASAAFSAAALLLCMCAGAAQGYSLMGFASSMQLASKGSLFSSNIGASPMLRLAPSLGLRARQQRASTAIKAQLYADEEKPKVRSCVCWPGRGELRPLQASGFTSVVSSSACLSLACYRRVPAEAPYTHRQ